MVISNRIYADSILGVRPTTRFQDQTSFRDNADNIVFNEINAKEYQEWNVIKRNVLGRKQERVMGIDEKIVYNAKRGQFSRNASGVHRHQREISTIRNVEILSNDKKTFKITWVEKSRETYDIEYTCESVRDCGEIVAKLKFLLGRQ